MIADGQQRADYGSLLYPGNLPSPPDLKTYVFVGVFKWFVYCICLCVCHDDNDAKNLSKKILFLCIFDWTHGSVVFDILEPRKGER